MRVRASEFTATEAAANISVSIRTHSGLCTDFDDHERRIVECWIAKHESRVLVDRVFSERSREFINGWNEVMSS